ncbi:MAG: ABC transporter ATP-binding protein [Clostridiales bacterium]|nr:ABC transporter ATP-binding protein [Clostridiales bacterium]
MQQQQEIDFTKRLDAGLWRRLIGYMKPFHKYLFAIMGTMALSAACDAIFPLLTREAIDRFITGSVTTGLAGFIARYAGTVLAQTGCIFGFCILCGRAECGINRHIRKMCFHRLQELSFSYYDTTPVGFIISRITSDTARLGETVAWGLVDLFWAGCYIVFTIVTMFFLNVKLALIVLAVMPVIAVTAVWFQKRILASYRLVRKTNSQITGAYNEGIMGAKTTKTLVREKANGEEFAQLAGTMRASSIHAAVMSALFMPIVTSLGAIAVALVLWQGGADVYAMTGALTIGTLAAFVEYAQGIFEPISSIARIFADLQASQAAAERVISTLETEPEITDTPEVVEKFGDSFHPKRENWPDIRGDIEFDHVTFHYNTGEEVLNDFSLKVRAGETVALVGETGSGKSTIVNLVCRFYEPTEGVIRIDGVDYRQRSMLWLQSHLGYVLQQPHLFSGTVRENIRFGRLDATDREIEAAAKLVDADGFIRGLENGYDTQVGEGGNRLSTGQKQLISFARALIANPAIFVLDEATSSVDTETEQKLQAAIQKALWGRTSFIIAHRLSTIRNADVILVIRDGRIVERGTHRELLRQNGYYHQLYVNQFREEGEAQTIEEINR